MHTPTNITGVPDTFPGFLLRISILFFLTFWSFRAAIAQSDPVAFRVIAVHMDGRQSVSNVAMTDRPLEVYVPTAFTPDGDGLNDVFQVKGEGIADFRLAIYDRWGKVVFESKAVIDGWDGKIDGVYAPIGMYAYELVAFGEEIGSVTKTGTITLAYHR